MPLYSFIDSHHLVINEFCFSFFDNKLTLALESEPLVEEIQLKLKQYLIKNLAIKDIDFIYLSENSFYNYMKKKHRLGGQYKISKMDIDGATVKEVLALNKNT
jgi:hypothetical protein